VYAGYWRRPDLTSAALHGNFFRTGDIGFWDEAGYLNVIGRASELIPGFPLHPREVEEIAHSHSAIKECALVEADGKTVLAYSVRRDHELSEAGLVTFLSSRLPAAALPARCARFVGDLPRSAAGNIVRSQIRNAFKWEVCFH